MFGSTIVAGDLHVATAYRRSHNLNVITLDGDRADRKGSLTGGYHDLRRSRLEGIKAEKAWRTKYDDDAKRLADVKRSIARIDQALTRTVGQVQVVEGKRKNNSATRESLVADLQALSREADQLKSAVERTEKVLAELEGEVQTLSIKLVAYEAEVGSPMTSGLSADEEKIVGELAKEVARLKDDLDEKTSERSEVRSSGPYPAGLESTTIC